MDFPTHDQFMEILSCYDVHYGALDGYAGKIIPRERIVIDPQEAGALETLVYGVLWHYMDYVSPTWKDVEWEKWFDLESLTEQYLSDNHWLYGLDLTMIIKKP